MDFLIVTNNSAVQDRFTDLPVVFVDGRDREVLRRVRDYIHAGHTLLTHPVSGSLKPGETPFRSVLISAAGNASVDAFSLQIFEECQQALDKFRVRYEGLSERKLDDFRAVDLSLIESAVPRAIADRR